MTLAGSLLLAAVFTRAMERVDSLDPAQAQSVYDSKVAQLIYETPLNVDYVARPYRLSPGLCELPEVSADGLEYRFVVCDGAPVEAADIARAIARLRDRDNPCAGSWTMRQVAAVEIPNRRTLTVRLKHRQHVFPWMMAMSTMGVRLADGSGTGPYRLASWWRNHEMVFERNREWRGWSANPAPFDQVRFLVVDDISTQWLMFLSGQIDYLGEIARDNWGAVIGEDGRLRPSLAAAGVRLLGGDTALEVRYIGINCRNRLLGGNRKLRQALNLGFDAPTWARFYNGGVSAADGPIPPGVAGRLETPFPYRYDEAAARRKLAEAGYPDGVSAATGERLSLMLSIGRPTQDSREAGELIASFYARIGVRIELDFRTWEAFLGAVNRGDVELFMMGWVGDYPDAENFLQCFYSPNRSPGANHCDYVSAEFDREYEAAMACVEAEEREERWRRCQAIVREDCPWIFLHFTRAYSLVRPRVLGMVPGDFPYGEEKYLRVEE